MKVARRFTFEAAHYLPNYEGICKALHGHTYVLEVEVEGGADAWSGFVIDFAELSEIVRRNIVSRLDHKCLNDIIKNPTAEYIALWCWYQIFNELPRGVQLSRIRLYETPECYAEVS